jgi:hypothetical protein
MIDTETYRNLLDRAGFEEIGIEVTRRSTVTDTGLDPATLSEGWEAADGKCASAFVPAPPQILG